MTAWAAKMTSSITESPLFTDLACRCLWVKRWLKDVELKVLNLKEIVAQINMRYLDHGHNTFFIIASFKFLDLTLGKRD